MPHEKINWEELMKPKPWYKEVYYWIYRIPDKVSFILAPKHKLQKEHRQIGLGYWDRPRKSFDFDAVGKLAWEIYPILVRFRRSEFHGAPMDFVDEDGEPDMDRWLEVIDKMIYSFYEILQDSVTIDFTFDLGALQDNQSRIEYGLMLFAQYFQNLWD